MRPSRKTPSDEEVEAVRERVEGIVLGLLGWLLWLTGFVLVGIPVCWLVAQLVESNWLGLYIGALAVSAGVIVEYELFCRYRSWRCTGFVWRDGK